MHIYLLLSIATFTPASEIGYVTMLLPFSNFNLCEKAAKQYTIIQSSDDGISRVTISASCVTFLQNRRDE